jgi:predicted regulator of Ras-like GTPase activity (Roadblock/LC7/MglB family)
MKMGIKQKLKDVLKKLSKNFPEIKEMLIITEDGFFIESLTGKTEQIEMLSPDIANALKSLKILTQETVKANPDEVLVTTPNGHLAVYHGKDIIAAFWTDKDSNLGILRTVIRKTLPEIEDSLSV